MSRQAPRPEPSSPEETARPSGALAPALAALIHEVDSPGVLRSDIDLLITVLRQGPMVEETPRARADALLGLMARDNPVGDHTGRNGTTVRQAAKAALLALGPSYALELPPELQEQVARPRIHKGPGVSGFIVTGVYGLCQTGLVLLAMTQTRFERMPTPNPLPSEIAFMMMLVWTPILISLSGHVLKLWWMLLIGSLGMVLQGALWGLIGGRVAYGLGIRGPFGVLLMPWHLALWSAWVMRRLPTPPVAPPPGS